MTPINTRRALAAIVAAATCTAIPATAQADAASRTDAAQLPRARSAPVESTFPSAEFRGGDNPAEYPGMSRAPRYDGPATIEVVRPERTIVRDVDEALPLILSSTALMLVLASIGVALVRTRIAPRPGRSH
jgi:hypothetical protein